MEPEAPSTHTNETKAIQLCYTLLNDIHPRLGKETKAIADLCNLMGQGASLNEEEHTILMQAAWLQGAGCIPLSPGLIRTYRESPDELTRNDLNTIQKHPIKGQELTNLICENPLVGGTVRSCRERWDGSGFPDGHLRETSPIMARYLAVAIYFVESSLDKEACIEKILEGSGHLFDPEAVRLFLKVTQIAKLPEKVRDVLFSELSPGMVLARNILSPEGLVLLPEGHTINETSLKKIVKHNMTDPIHHQILVYAT